MFGHSAFRVEIPKAVILIDPFIGQNPSCNVPLKEAIQGGDAYCYHSWP